jgi:acetolactate synthase-1/2/3 large subunit
MSELNGGHLVARTLKQAGVGHIFTLCGGHILPIYDGCITEDVQVVDMRHEQACAHAADAYARLTRNIGVAVVTAGPGVTDAVTGIANAYSARSPVLLIGGAAPLGLRGLGSLQEVEQVDLLRPITKGSWTVSETRQIPEVLTTAIRHALTGRPGPVFVEIRSTCS